MAKSMVDEILAAEEKAKEIIAMANENAKTAKEKAITEANALVDSARTDAEQKANEQIAQASESANAKQNQAHGDAGFVKQVLEKETGTKYDSAVDAAITKLRS